MIIIIWNYRDLSPSLTIPYLKELVRAIHPDMIFLFETLSYGVRLEALRVSLNFSNCLTVDCVGRSGDLAVLWNNKISCSVLSYCNNHII